MHFGSIQLLTQLEQMCRHLRRYHENGCQAKNQHLVTCLTHVQCNFLALVCVLAHHDWELVRIGASQCRPAGHGMFELFEEFAGRVIGFLTILIIGFLALSSPPRLGSLIGASLLRCEIAEAVRGQTGLISVQSQNSIGQSWCLQLSSQIDSSVT